MCEEHLRHFGGKMSLIGTMAPPFKAPAVTPENKIAEFRLDDFKGQWVVLFFYPLDFTIVCPTEITQFREFNSEFTNKKAIVVGCSVDSVYSHKKWMDSDLGELGFYLVSDIKKTISRDYDCHIENQGVATRATYIIDPEGCIQYASQNNLNVGRDVHEILRVLDALQTGEMCGAGWTKGSQTLNSNV